MKIIAIILAFCLIQLTIAQPTNFLPFGIGGGGAMFFPKINPANDNEFYISCDMSELFHSTDFGKHYSQLPFTQFQALNVSTYEFTINPLIAYSNFNDGNEGYPVKTTNGGLSWSRLQGFDANNGGIYRMFANYNNPQQLLMNYYGEIVISNDGGNSFSLVKKCTNNGVGIIISGVFYDNNEIYIATNEGIFRSLDNGASFSKFTTTGIPSGQVIWQFGAAKSNNGIRFVCITASESDVYNGLMPYDYYGLAKGVFVMDNKSGSWISKSNGIDFNSDFVMYVGMATNDIQTIYLGGSDDALNAPLVYKTEDGGTSWKKVFKSTNNQNITTGWSGYQGDKNWSWGETTFGIAVAPNNAQKIVFGDFGFVHVSTDGGNNWNQAYIDEADQHPSNNSTPKQRNYHSIGLENTSSWQIHWIDAQNLFAAYSDIGAIRSRDGGKSWSFDYNGFSVNSLYRFVQNKDGNLYGACSNIHDMYQSTRLNDAKLDANDSNGKIVFSTDKGENWTTLHSFNHPVFWLAIDPNNSNTMYASVIHYGNGAGQGGIWVTNDMNKGSASTWTKLPNPPRTEGHPASIQVLKNGLVVCTFSGRRNSSGTFTNSSGVFVYDPKTGSWADRSHSGMYYWTKDIVIDPTDPTENTWYVGVFSGWGGAPNGLGGLYRTKDGGQNWLKLTGNQFDRVTSLTFNPTNLNQAYITTETDGLWVSNNISNTNPTFSLVSSYNFRQPERVFFNPFNQDEMWVTSFGNGLKMGKLNNTYTSEINQDLSISAYPNPFRSSITLNVNQTNDHKDLKFFDILGSEIFRKKIDSQIVEIDTRDWNSGIYIVKCGEQEIKIFKPN